MRRRLPRGLWIFVTLFFAALLVERAAWADDPTAGLAPITGAIDRETPRKAVTGFIASCKSGNYMRAAYYLDLRGIPSADRLDKGPALSSDLCYVLSHEKLDGSELPDTADGSDATGKGATTTITGANLYIGEEPVPITWVRVKFSDGVSRWVLARTTVAMIPELDDAFGPKGWRTKLPAWLTRPTFLGNELWQWIGIFGFAFASYVVGRFAAYLFIRITTRVAKGTILGTNDRLIVALRRPLRTVIASTLFRAALVPLDLTKRVDALCTRCAYTALVIALAWLVLRVLGVTASWMQERAQSGEGHTESRSRAVRTQLTLIRRLASVVVTLVASAVIALQFEFVRNVGVSLLASAGILSVVVGFAAQKSLAGVIAGIQLFVAQPVRIGDSVEIEGDAGEMEELNLTYAVVRLWDERRMVVPIAKLLDTSFKNLSLAPKNLLGTVELIVDSATPVEAVRAKLVDICQSSGKWDKETCVLQVTDATEKGMKLRALVSASTSGRLFELRCEIREQLLAFLRDLDDGRYYAHQRHAPTATPIHGADRPSTTNLSSS